MATFDKPNTMTSGLNPTWQQTLLHAVSAAELAASPKPSTFDVSILVDKNDADLAGAYQWEPMSGATPDNVYVIGHQNSATQLGRWLLILTDTSSPTALSSQLVMRWSPIGDSTTLTGGYSPAEGAWRVRCEEILREQGYDLRGSGPSWSANPTHPRPLEPSCSAYSGDNFAVMTARLISPGVIYGWYSTSTAFLKPIVVPVWMGINDAATLAGTAVSIAAAMEVSWATMATAIDALFPTARKIAMTLAHLFTPTAPTAGLATANAAIDLFNAWLIDNAPLRPLWSTIDVVAGFTGAETKVGDGTHLSEIGYNQVGARVATEIMRLFPIAPNRLASPRKFRARTTQASALFTTVTTDKIVTGADAGWRLLASNFVGGMRIAPTDLTGAGANFIAIVTQTPNGQNYTHGLMVGYDASVNPPNINVYIGSTITAACSTRAIASVGQDALHWLFWHGDRTNGIISVWLGTKVSGAQGAPWRVAQIGRVTSVAAWAIADASPELTVAKNVSYPGFAGGADSVFFSCGSNIPNAESIRPYLENVMFDGGVCPDITGLLPCNEGTGAACASGIPGGSAGVLTGGWSAAGALCWPSDDTTLPGWIEPLAYSCTFDNDCTTLGAGGALADITEIVSGSIMQIVCTPRSAKLLVSFSIVGDNATVGFATIAILKDGSIITDLGGAGKGQLGFTAQAGSPSACAGSWVIACVPGVATTIKAQWKGTTGNARCRPATDPTNSIGLTATEVR